jgi:hypothetical protein
VRGALEHALANYRTESVVCFIIRKTYKYIQKVGVNNLLLRCSANEAREMPIH